MKEKRRTNMRCVMVFVVMAIVITSALGIYGIFQIGSGTAQDIEENRSAAQPVSEDESAMESVQTDRADWEPEGDGADAEEEAFVLWPVYIPPDVPEPLAEVLEQYEKLINAGFEKEDFSDRGSDKWNELEIEEFYVYDEVYLKWPYSAEDERDTAICYSLKDLTGDGALELIMGSGYRHDGVIVYYASIVYYIGKEGDIRCIESTPYYDLSMYEGGIIESVSAGVDYTITYWKFSQEEQDWQLVEALGAEWDNENARDVRPYRQVIVDGEYVEEEMLSDEEFQRIKEQYTQKRVELEWHSLSRPDWHILVSSNGDYDLYLEGISTDFWLEATGERRLCFTVYDREGTLVQELVEISPYLPYMPDAKYVVNTDIDRDEGWGYKAGDFYFQDMNFDGKEDLVLLWSNINHSFWKVYLWREEEGVFREADEGIFCYYDVVEEKQYIDEYVPNGHDQTEIYRWRYDEETGYLCAGALTVYSGDEGAGSYQEHFYEDGSFERETGIISREEVSRLWSDVLE